MKSSEPARTIVRMGFQKGSRKVGDVGRKVKVKRSDECEMGGRCDRWVVAGRAAGRRMIEGDGNAWNQVSDRGMGELGVRGGNVRSI